MNNRERADDGIAKFLSSERKVLLLTGTHQYQKHVLALRVVLRDFPAPATILFRTVHSNSYNEFLAPILDLKKKLKAGVATPVTSGHQLYVDTINRSTWRSGVRHVDVAVLYPIDACSPDAGTEAVADLQYSRGARKVLLITWTDNRDIAWVEHYSPTRVIYDAEEERPDYHERVNEHLRPAPATAHLSRVPKYAVSTPSNLLIRIRCTRCNSSRYARLNQPYPGLPDLCRAERGLYVARCLKCGEEARDNYGWLPP